MLTLHHLNYSRSIRVIWLLEELGIEYDLVKYERDENFRAPSALKAIHPLGKAPVLVDESLACTSDFDDEAEPEWEDQLGLSEYPREQQRSRAARRTSPTG